jgi:hypothetical protein
VTRLTDTPSLALKRVATIKSAALDSGRVECTPNQLMSFHLIYKMHGSNVLIL